ncbi:MAG: glutamate 5-kinase [Lachnospiraceae bacterium]|nr:glutamate 5-kinase [Lachnospiraceae bacterium]
MTDREQQVRAQAAKADTVVVKVGSSTLTHKNGTLHLERIEKLVRALCELKNRGKRVVLVSSGAVAAGRTAIQYAGKPETVAEKQALAAIGQGRLMMLYERLFGEYGAVTAQILLTRDTVEQEESRENACATFARLLDMGVVPVVNENDTVATHEIKFGDNDRLSAITAKMIGADLLVLLSDVEGLFTDNPAKDPAARRIGFVPELTEEILAMGSGESASSVGTGGMTSKLLAAQIACVSGIPMMIASGKEPEILYRILAGEEVGTLFAPVQA